MKRKLTYCLIGAFAVTASLLFSFKGKEKAIDSTDPFSEKENSSISESIKEIFSSKEEIVELSPIEYTKWCEDSDNGLVLSKTIGDFEYTAFYKPTEYIALTELDVESADKNAIESKIAELGDMEYFSFRIKSLKETTELLKVNLESQEQYYSRLEYISFKMQNDFKLIDKADTLDCVLYHFERVYNLVPHATIVLGFPKRKSKSDLRIVYEDKIFNNGNIIMTLQNKTLNALPKLKL